MANYSNIKFSNAQSIGRLYGLKILDFSPILQGNSNSNYYLKTEDTSFVLSIVESNSFERVENLLKLLAYLKEQHYFTSQVYLTTQKESLIPYIGKPLFLKK